MNFITVEGIQNQTGTKLWLKEDNIIFIRKNKIREDYVLYYKITEKEWNRGRIQKNFEAFGGSKVCGYKMKIEMF